MENDSQNPDVSKEVFVARRNPDETNPLLFVCPQRYRETASIDMSGCFNIRINGSLAEVIGSKLKILTERNYAGKGSLYRIESKYFSNKRILVVDKNISE